MFIIDVFFETILFFPFVFIDLQRSELSFLL